VIVFALGFVPALIISWAYELTPEGLKREKDVVRDASITHLTAKRLDGITIGLIVVALVFLLADRLWLSPRLAEQSVASVAVVTDTLQTSEHELTGPQYPPNSIAVLPFVNMSDDAGNEYFSDGISEELLNLLSKIPELRVISRSSAFSFKGKDFAIPTIAAQLNVAHILEGSVRKAGNQVRITAQLIDVRSDTHLWSETYDRKLEDIFAIQDEISAAIVGALKENLGLEIEAIPSVTTAANTKAHDAYQRGRYLVVQRTPATLNGAVREFEKALAIDPDYALAHAELAMAILLSQSYRDDLTTTEAVAGARAAPHVERAMALDPNLAEAHAAAGYFLW
jgi:TolB-like protein